MNHIFLTVVNMSVNASYVIIVVLLARLFLKKGPKIFSYALWFVVLFRLLCPITITSSFGILPANQLSLMRPAFYDSTVDASEGAVASDTSANMEQIVGTDTAYSTDSTTIPELSDSSQTNAQETNTNINSNTNNLNNTNSNTISNINNANNTNNNANNTNNNTNNYHTNNAIGTDRNQNTLLIQGTRAFNTITANESIADRAATLNPIFQIVLQIMEMVWLIGILVIAGYSILSLCKVKERIANANKVSENIYEKDALSTPFVVGLLRPRIYLPTGLRGEEREYILAHEKMHIKRLDYVVKLLAFVTLILHWMNPLVWISFILLTKDMEMSCDEAVIRRMGMNIKKDYSVSLLNMATEKACLTGTPLAFGEGNVKGRIKNILHYKKAGIGMIVLCVAVVAVISIFFATNREQLNDTDAEKYDITGIENKAYPSNLEQMYQWRTEYVGDNSAVGNITDAWFIDEDTPLQKDGCELQTAAEPYEVTVRYQAEEPEHNAYDANIVYFEKDAALFFCLVHNAGIVNISINEQIMESFTRTEMESKFGDLWSMSASYEDFCKTYDYITYLQSTFAEENQDRNISAENEEQNMSATEDIASLDEVMDRLVKTIGTEQALPFNNTVDLLPNQDALIKLCVSQDGKYEAFGCISPEYGFRGIILNNIIAGKANHNYLYDEWNYSEVAPELITMNPTQLNMAYIEPVYHNGTITKHIRYFTGYDTGTLAEKDKPEIILQEEDIFRISVTNGSTGEKKEYSRLDSNTGFLDLLLKYESMMLELSENKAERISGYQYAFNLYDNQDNLLQTFYLQGSEIDVAGDTRYQEAGLGSIGEFYLVVDSMFESVEAETSDTAFTSQIDLKGPQEIPGVQMIVTSYTDRTANVVLTNTTDVELFYGDWFSIQKKVSGQWQAAAFSEDGQNLMFKDIAYNLFPGGISTWQVNWGNIYGKLPAGEYRIMKSIDNSNASTQEGGSISAYIGAEFTIQ